MQTCEEFQGKLFTLNDCNQLPLLRDDLVEHEYKFPQTFMAGLFANVPTGSASERRRQPNSETSIDS